MMGCLMEMLQGLGVCVSDLRLLQERRCEAMYRAVDWGTSSVIRLLASCILMIRSRRRRVNRLMSSSVS